MAVEALTVPGGTWVSRIEAPRTFRGASTVSWVLRAAGACSWKYPIKGNGVLHYACLALCSVIQWEKTALDLAKNAGITVPVSELLRVSNRPVLVLNRFDRAPGGDRAGYMSAMTATSSNDGEHADYLDVFDSHGHYSADFYTDTDELFRSAAVSGELNT